MYSLEMIRAMNAKESNSFMRKEVYEISSDFSMEQLALIAHNGIGMQQHSRSNENKKKYLVIVKVEEIE